MRSKCHKIERLVSDYIDGTLPERQAANVTLHIRSCRSCKREVAGLKKTQHLLKNFYVEPEASDTYYAQFTTQLQKRIEQSAPTAFHQRFAAATTRLGWQLLTEVYRYADRLRPIRFISIRQHTVPYYVLAFVMTVLNRNTAFANTSFDAQYWRTYTFSICRWPVWGNACNSAG